MHSVASASQYASDDVGINRNHGAQASAGHQDPHDPFVAVAMVSDQESQDGSDRQYARAEEGPAKTRRLQTDRTRPFTSVSGQHSIAK